jgi:curved DNA-binding protein CbpA
MTQIKKDPYKLLGVPKTASQEEIKRAYRRVARQTHPDVNPADPGAADQFIEVQKAYEILSDPDCRRAFDQGGYEVGLDLADLMRSPVVRVTVEWNIDGYPIPILSIEQRQQVLETARQSGISAHDAEARLIWDPFILEWEISRYKFVGSLNGVTPGGMASATDALPPEQSEGFEARGFVEQQRAREVVQRRASQFTEEYQFCVELGRLYARTGRPSPSVYYLRRALALRFTKEVASSVASDLYDMLIRLQEYELAVQFYFGFLDSFPYASIQARINWHAYAVKSFKAYVVDQNTGQTAAEKLQKLLVLLREFPKYNLQCHDEELNFTFNYALDLRGYYLLHLLRLALQARDSLTSGQLAAEFVSDALSRKTSRYHELMLEILLVLDMPIETIEIAQSLLPKRLTKSVMSGRRFNISQKLVSAYKQVGAFGRAIRLSEFLSSYKPDDTSWQRGLPNTIQRAMSTKVKTTAWENPKRGELIIPPPDKLTFKLQQRYAQLDDSDAQILLGLLNRYVGSPEIEA